MWFLSREIFPSVPIFLHKPGLDECRTAQLHSGHLQMYEFWVGQKRPQFLIMLNVAWPVCFCLRREWSPLTFHWGWINNSSKWRWNPLQSEVGDHPRVSRAGVDVPSPIETAKAFTKLILKSVGWWIFHVIFVSYPVLWPKLKSSTHTLRTQELLDVCFREDTDHTWCV